MITIFTTPKPFLGHNGIIQENAIKSWKRLVPACEVILLGKGHGIAEAARKYGCKYFEGVACTEYGTPFVHSLFLEAESLSSHPIMCYANCDIIFTNALNKAVQLVCGRNKFLIVGQRYNVDIDFEWDFDDPEWEARLTDYIGKYGVLNTPRGIDFFVFPKGAIKNIPDLVIGRAWWDNWMIYNARLNFIPVIDATDLILAVHQNHDYSHYKGGHNAAYYDGAEVKNNISIMNDGYVVLTIKDAIWVISNGEVKFAFDRLGYHLRQFTKIWPWLRGIRKTLRKFLGPNKALNI